MRKSHCAAALLCEASDRWWVEGCSPPVNMSRQHEQGVQWHDCARWAISTPSLIHNNQCSDWGSKDFFFSQFHFFSHKHTSYLEHWPQGSCEGDVHGQPAITEQTKVKTLITGSVKARRQTERCRRRRQLEWRALKCHCDSLGPLWLRAEGTNSVTTSPWLRSRPRPSFSCTEMQTTGMKMNH